MGDIMHTICEVMSGLVLGSEFWLQDPTVTNSKWKNYVQDTPRYAEKSISQTVLFCWINDLGIYMKPTDWFRKSKPAICL